MLNLISCELLKLKRSKMVLISVAGVLSTPLLMLIEALQTHFDKPEIIFTLSDIYSDSVLYIMLLVNIMIYVAIAAYLFSREYTESTLKTILPIPISRTKLLIGKFCTLLLWIVMLTLVTWAGIFIVCGLYDAVFTLEGYSLLVAIVWLPKFLFGSILMFLTTHSGWFNKVFFKQNWRNYGNSIYIRPQNRNSLAVRLRNGSVRAIMILAITGG